MSWIYQNFSVYSGNMPPWADWDWRVNKELKKAEAHFVALVTGLHPAGGAKALCCHTVCRKNPGNSVYKHHYFDCPAHISNRIFFVKAARCLYFESPNLNTSRLQLSLLESVLAKPSPFWVGLVDQSLFLNGLKLRAIHELHRILIMASISSWSRFYELPPNFS